MIVTLQPDGLRGLDEIRSCLASTEAPTFTAPSAASGLNWPCWEPGLRSSRHLSCPRSADVAR